MNAPGLNYRVPGYPLRTGLEQLSKLHRFVTAARASRDYDAMLRQLAPTSAPSAARRT